MMPIFHACPSKADAKLRTGFRARTGRLITRGALSLLAAFALPARGDVKLPALFSDHMVLQQDIAIPVWGWAVPGESVTVSIAGEKQTTTTGANGKWMVKLSPLRPGTVQQLTVAGKNTITIQDVLVGEVWVCSGQSNMEFRLNAARNSTEEIAAANFPEIRCFTVPITPLPAPAEEVQGKWEVCAPATAAEFTAVGYFFGRELHKALEKPIGLINTSVGATPAEAWTSIEGLATDPDLKAMADQQIAKLSNYPEDCKRFDQAMKEWESKYGSDTDNKGIDRGWAKPEFDDSNWKPATLPIDFSKLGIQTGGSVWFRKDIDIPTESTGTPLTITLGYGRDDKAAYFNGSPLKARLFLPRFYNQFVTFAVPPQLVHKGKNTIAIRVYSHGPDGGISQFPTKIVSPIKVPSQDIAKWRYSVETAGPALTPEARATLPVAPTTLPKGTSAQLFNGMVNPLIPYAVRGAIWYQGEGNNRGYQYRRLLPTLIQDWRHRWAEGDFPFYIVQLPNYRKATAQPGSSAWAELREAQSLTAKNVPNTGLAVTIDIGEADEIHPKNKQDVGYRLALVALHKTYGRQLEYSGPVYESSTVEGNTIRLKFSHADGLTAKGGPLKQFAVAGEDRKFVWANARIDGDSVLISSPQVDKPVAARYAWADNPEGCNLYNAADLPASPFRTDDWPGVTFNNLR